MIKYEYTNSVGSGDPEAGKLRLPFNEQHHAKIIDAKQGQVMIDDNVIINCKNEDGKPFDLTGVEVNFNIDENSNGYIEIDTE
jgi:hypothetical protein